MLKLALSLAAILILTTPSFADTKCTAPTKFVGATEIAGDDLVEFKKASTGLPEQVDLVLVLKDAPVLVAFVKGCAIGYGIVTQVAPKSDDGKI